MDDEVDEHHRGRDKISLDPDAPSSDDDDLDDEEAVMDIDADTESEDSEDSDESDSETSEGEGAKGGKAKPRADRSEGGAESASDEDEAALYKAMKAQQKKLNSRAPTRARRDDSDTDDASDSDSEDRGAGVRGARKADFYGDDEVDHEGASDEDERVEEEREALRLQRVAADEMDAADFGLEDESDDDESDDDRATPLGAKAKALAGGAGKKPSAKKEKKEKKEKKALGAAVESLGADPSLAGSLASDVVASDAPELIALTKELTRNLDEVRCSVEPVIAAARAGDLATAEGVSYLDAKHLLMLSYCVNIVFYLLLKAEGRPVRDHPVVLRLVEIRTYLEKLRPVDRKLRYQIDKLVKMADRPSEERAAEEEDPLAFRPNPDALVSKVDEDAEEGGAGGAYRPPKMLPTAMEGEFEEGGKSNKEKRKEKEARKRANRSALIKVREAFEARMVFCFSLFSSGLSRPAAPRRAPNGTRTPPRVPLASSFFGRFRRRAIPWRPQATISFRGTERTYQILGRVPFKSHERLSNQEMDISTVLPLETAPSSPAFRLPRESSPLTSFPFPRAILSSHRVARLLFVTGTRARARGGPRGARRGRRRDLERVRQARARAHGGAREDRGGPLHARAPLQDGAEAAEGDVAEREQRVGPRRRFRRRRRGPRRGGGGDGRRRALPRSREARRRRRLRGRREGDQGAEARRGGGGRAPSRFSRGTYATGARRTRLGFPPARIIRSVDDTASVVTRRQK